MNIQDYANAIIEKSERKLWTTKRWDTQIKLRSLHIKKDHQLQWLHEYYPQHIEMIKNRLVLEKNKPIAKEDDFQDIYNEIMDIQARRNEIELKLLNYKNIDMGEVMVLQEEYKTIRDRKRKIKESIFRNKWIVALEEKIERLEDKLATTVKEVDIRDQNLLARTPIGTTYYMDLDSGNDGSDGLSTGNAWLTINKYTTTTARTPGDVLKIRAGTSQTVSADVAFDEDGLTDFITIKGCDSDDDPWSDSSDVRPVFDFNSGAYQFYVDEQNWKFENLEFRDGDDAYGMVRIYGNYTKLMTIFENCKFVEYGEPDNDEGALQISSDNKVLVNNCEFDNNYYNHICLQNSGGHAFIIIKNTTFEGGQEGGSTDYVLFYEAGGMAYMENCQIGQNDALDVAYGIKCYMITGAARLFANNVTFQNGSTPVLWQQMIYDGESTNCDFRSSDHQGVPGASFYINSFIGAKSDTVNVRSGGSDISLDIFENYYPVFAGLQDRSIPHDLRGEFEGLWKVWVLAEETTITVYIKGYDWTTQPTSSQLYLRAKYLSDGSNADRSEETSSQAITDNSTWTAYSVTITPSQAGWVYLDLVASYWEDDAGIYVDLEPVLS